MEEKKKDYRYRLFAIQMFLILQLLGIPHTGSANDAELTFPNHGSTLSNISQSFTWRLDTGNESWLYLGSSAGGNDIYNSGSLGQANGADVYALPNDGRTIFLRLFYRSPGQSWRFLDHTFQAHTGTSAINLLSPQPGSTITDTRQLFTWQGDGINEWWMYIGSSVGGNDIYNSGNLGSVTSANLSALPHDGRTMYVRLYYRQTGAAWRYHDYTLGAHTGDHAIRLLSPAPGTTVTDSTQTLTWQAIGIDQWWLYLGSVVGASDIYNSGNLGSTTTTTVSVIPASAQIVHVRLFYKQNNAAWRFVDYSFNTNTRTERIVDTDLVALHYDVAPDLDDLHAIAAGANLSDKFGVSPAVVIGAYGLVGQGGNQDSDLKYLYDTATSTLGQGPNIGETRRQKAQQVADAAYGSGTYLDTGNGWTSAVNAQAIKFWDTLQSGYTVSVADGGPMDFTADVLKRLQSFHGATPTQLKRVMVVQHSLGFNVSNTLPANRAIVRNLATYVTIDNGNVGGNTTANLEDSGTNTTSSGFAQWARSGNSQSAAWNSALNDFSAKIDFSDTVEYLYILDVPLSSVSDINSFANFF